MNRALLNHEEYTVGWVCALPLELAAATSMLDECHLRLPNKPGDDNMYNFGRIGQHNIVIACLPSGHYGTTNAAVVANNMQRSFPSIDIRLMVGIGGGVPSKTHDIRLGDIVVGQRVMDYDLGKMIQGGSVHLTSSAVEPPQKIMKAVSNLQALHHSTSTQIPALVTRMLNSNPNMGLYNYPAHLRDRLFRSTYEHQIQTESCDHCDSSELVERPIRSGKTPKVHYGMIGSGNKVIKHAETRDDMARNHNILCFEMEAAGLISHFPCLVIRGICDYCDSHKNKEWQHYAAAVAAGYAKELLLIAEPKLVAMSTNSKTTYPGSAASKTEKEEFLGSLSFDTMYDRRYNIRSAYSETCRWFRRSETYLDWMNPQRLRQHGGFLWIKGKPGAGKSTLMHFLVEKQELERNFITISFFFNARGHQLEKSTEGMYRSLLVQLFENIPGLFGTLREEPRMRHLGWTTKSLEKLLELTVERLGSSSVACYIDALDEGDEDEIRDMVTFFERIAQLTMSTGLKFYVCFSSRHYPHIGLREGLGLEVVLEDERSHGADIALYVDNMLKIGQSKIAKDIRREVQDRSSGVFMWAVLVVGILNKEHDRGRIYNLSQRLGEIPRDLQTLFRDILTSHGSPREELLLVFQLLLCARRPLAPKELYFAVLSQFMSEPLDPRDVSIQDIQIFLIENSKGLVEVTRGSDHPTVQFIHETVRDFLFEQNTLGSLWPELNVDDFISKTHLRLRDCCQRYLFSEVSRSLNYDRREPTTGRGKYEPPLYMVDKFPFFNYAVMNLFYHADRAYGTANDQTHFLSTFPLQKWVEYYNLSSEGPRVPQLPPSTRLLYVLAEMNASSLLQSCDSLTSCIDEMDEPHICPLVAAVVNRSREATVVLYKALESSLAHDSPYWSWKRRFAPDLFKSDHGIDLNSFWSVGNNRSLMSFLSAYGDLELVAVVVYSRIQQRDPSSLDICNFQDSLHQAIRYGNGEVFEFLLETELIELDSANDQGLTPLSVAAMCGKADIVKLLLETGRATPDCKDIYQLTPLQLAVHFKESPTVTYLEPEFSEAQGRLDIVQELLATGRVDPNSRDYEGKTPLSKAAQLRVVNTVKFLLDSGAVDPDLADDLGETPLFKAAEAGDEDIVRMLLETGKVNPNSISNAGCTPLMIAVETGREEVVKLLLDIDEVDPDPVNVYGETPLLLAFACGLDSIVNMLLGTDQVDPSRADSYGQTALFLAALHNRPAVVRRLLKTGRVDPNSLDSDGRSPLLVAAAQNLDIVEALLESDQVDPDVADNCGRTPLMVAVDCRGEEIVKRLLEIDRVSLNVADLSGNTPLSLAVTQGEEAIVRALLETGRVNGNLLDGKGESILQMAAKGGYKSIFIHLQQYADEKYSQELRAEDSSSEASSGGVYLGEEL
ncbi:unnamed protein product [Clonostachys rosea]|uniref:Nucleoside phosphorylase domain-containing protein n=1 Tax=Bionectria ochroleuca TaxID=29856 RepID=A0ABY6TPS6_BIOOC|nr:unnamed protein product [Clonostachys rosea]